MGDLNLDYLCKLSPTHKKLKLLERKHTNDNILFSLPQEYLLKN